MTRRKTTFHRSARAAFTASALLAVAAAAAQTADDSYMFIGAGAPSGPATPPPEVAGRTTLSDGIDINASVASALPPPDIDTPLFLSVALNDRDTRLIAEFTQHAGSGRLSSKRGELAELGIRAPSGSVGRVYLDEIEGLDYDYDPIGQTIAITAPFAALLPRVQSAAPRATFEEPDRSYGAVLNYALSTEFGPDGGEGFGYTGFNAAFDAWLYAPFGTLSSTGLYSHSSADPDAVNFVRQETTLEFNNLRHALTLGIGDVTSSATAWSRPIRMGGVQLRRDFSLRSDIVTEQLFSFSGAAAVPSTVDIYVENNRAWTGEVDSGPFRLEDVPVSTGGGDAVVVIRDATGRETTREVSFFTTPDLLKKGTFDFSLETGYAREAYGIESNRYGEDRLFSATLSYGLTKRITLEAHVEKSDDLTLAGVGVHAAAGRLGDLSFAVGQSDYDDTRAGFLYGAFSTSIGKVNLQMSTMRAQAGFADLALVTGESFLGADTIADSGSLLEFPTANDVISLGIPIGEDYRNLGLSLVHSERDNSSDLIAAMSYSHSFDRGGTNFSVNGSHNFDSDESRLSMSLTMPLGKRTNGRAQVSTASNGRRVESLYASRSLSEGVGDFGYTARLERQEQRLYGGGSVSYLGRYGKVSGEVLYTDGSSYLRGTAEGAIVLAGGQPAIGNTISDSFAVVRTGVADVPIQVHNREVTRTGRGGRALVPGLTSYRSSRVSVDPDKLDDGVVLGATGADVVPTRRGGVLVDFALEGASGTPGAAALVTLVDARGRAIAPGSEARIGGRGAAFPVGYDGLTYLDGLKAQNTVKVDLASGGSCTARFAHAASDELQPRIGPFRCE